jgi:adenosylhomocysteinase
MPAVEVAGVTPAMPVLADIARELARDVPLAGRTVLLNLHLTHETLTLAETLRAGGAAIIFLPSNRNPAPQDVIDRAQTLGEIALDLDDVAHRRRGAQPLLAVEGNGRLFTDVHARPEVWPDVRGISMHTSGGGFKVDAAGDSALPLVALYRDRLKGDIETGLGTAQSSAAALLAALRAPIAGRITCVVGYGNAGRGVARTVAALGARVVAVDIDPERVVRARLDGITVAPLAEALARAEICITTTGRRGVITRSELERCRPGIIFANVSDQPAEVDVDGCEPLGDAGEWTDAWRAGRSTFYRLGRGIQVNHVVVLGNPAELMDLTFSLHALIVRWLAAEPRPRGVHPVPDEVRSWVARRYAQHMT